MPASPYDGTEETDLLEIKAFFLKCLKGKSFSAQNIPGLSYARRVESLKDVREELILVNNALDNLSDDPRFTDRTYMSPV